MPVISRGRPERVYLPVFTGAFGRQIIPIAKELADNCMEIYINIYIVTNFSPFLFIDIPPLN